MKQLPELCNITTGKLDANAAVDNGIYPYFTCGEEPARINEYAFDCDAILIAGNNAQGNFHVSRYNGKFNAYQRTYVLTAKENSNLDFVYYSLKLSLEQLRTRSQGSQTKFLTIPILNAISINDTLNQKKIADVLSCIDDKIAMNNKTNTELENMAKTIYDYWFTQFDFPDKNGHPYKTSGGQMVYNKILKREIPVGWEVGNLYNIAEYINGLACQNFRPKENESYLPVIKIREMHDGFSVDTEKVSSNIPDKYKIKNGDILFSWSATLETMIWVHGEGGLNQHIFKVVPKSYFSKEFVYQQLRQYIINFQMIALSRKTTMGHITSDHIEQSTITLPPREVIIQYTSSIKSIFDKSLQLQKENMELTKLRDYLLPLLMNGQVEVK